jgi:hypothetical protein
MRSARICDVDNQAEADLLCSVLDERHIPYALKTIEDRAYDGLYTSQGPWGFIEAPMEYGETINQVLSDLRASHSATPATGSVVEVKAMRPRLIGPVGLTLIVVLIGAVAFLLLRNTLLRAEISHLSERTFITWKWDTSTKSMQGRLRENGRLRYEEFDRNENHIYEERVSYLPDGKHVVYYFDDDEDGNPNRYVLRERGGKIVSESRDMNQSGLFELSIIYYGIGQSIEYHDNDDDGVADTLTVHSEGKTWDIDARQMFSK